MTENFMISQIMNGQGHSGVHCKRTRLNRGETGSMVLGRAESSLF